MHNYPDINLVLYGSQTKLADGIYVFVETPSSQELGAYRIEHGSCMAESAYTDEIMWMPTEESAAFWLWTEMHRARLT